MSKHPLRISASSLKTLTDCALSFYYSRVLRLPEKQWARTVVGSLVHSIFECLRHPRHRDHYDLLVGDRSSVNYRRSPAVARLVRMWAQKHGITDDLLADLNGMLYVGLALLDFHWYRADLDPVTAKPRIYGPEHAFEITLDDGTVIKGFIDDMAVVEGTMIVRDFKSARNKPTQAEIPDNVQAILYQLYVWRTFKLPARVEFVYLRHPPTARSKTKHLQIVEPASPVHLEGLLSYVRAMYARINSLTLEEAATNPHEDLGFCQRVCTHYAPHPYWTVHAKDDPTGILPHLSAHLDLDSAKKAAQDGAHVILERVHPGCHAKWRG